MLSLIHHATGNAQFKETLQEGIRFLGGYSTYIQPTFSPEQKNVPKVFEEDAYTRKKIEKAQTIYKGTQNIEGTLAEKYLREYRGIHGTLNNETFRYHPKLKNWMTGEIYPALVIAARDDKEQVCGVQAIFLDPKTAKKAPLGDHVKLSRGLIGEGALVHKGLPSGKTVLAEGPETALSVAEAHPDWTVHVTFGVSNFDKVGLKTGAQQILIAADNDGRDSGTAKSVSRAANLLSRKGIDVFVAEPIKPESVKKWDFNDALLKFGVTHVKQTLDQATLFKAGVTSERLAQETKDIFSRLPKSTQIPDSPEISGISKIDAQSLHDIFKDYVEMEIEQTRLVNAMHSARLKDPKNSQDLVAQALSHSNAIHDFAKEAVKHPEVKAEIEKLKNIRPQTLAQRGGFMALRDKVLRKSLTNEDIQVLTMQLRNKASDLARSQARDRDRGGRSK